MINKMEKQQLRKEILLKWKNSSKRMEIQHSIYKRLFHLNIWENANIIGLTHSKDTEWDTTRLIEKAWDQKKTITIPKSNSDTNTMKFYQYAPGDRLEITRKNIKE